MSLLAYQHIQLRCRRIRVWESQVEIEHLSVGYFDRITEL